MREICAAEIEKLNKMIVVGPHEICGHVRPTFVLLGTRYLCMYSRQFRRSESTHYRPHSIRLSFRTYLNEHE